MKSKTCFKCHEVKDLSEFYRHKQMGDGFLNKCKECTKLDVHARSIEKSEYVRAYDKKRYRTDFNRIKSSKYRGIVNRCTGNHKDRKYKVEGMKYLTREEFDKWWDDNIFKFSKCYRVWEASGFRNKYAPSIDRINNNKGYIPDNMQWLLLTDNCKKHTS